MANVDQGDDSHKFAVAFHQAGAPIAPRIMREKGCKNCKVKGELLVAYYSSCCLEVLCQNCPLTSVLQEGHNWRKLL